MPTLLMDSYPKFSYNEGTARQQSAIDYSKLKRLTDNMPRTQ